MCFKSYTYPYFTYISNFQFYPTHKSHQSYHTQPKHTPSSYHIKSPNIITPPLTPTSHCYIHSQSPHFYITHITTFISYLVIHTPSLYYPYPYLISNINTHTINLHPHISPTYPIYISLTSHQSPTHIPSYTPIIITTYSVYIPISKHTLITLKTISNTPPIHIQYPSPTFTYLYKINVYP